MHTQNILGLVIGHLLSNSILLCCQVRFFQVPTILQKTPRSPDCSSKSKKSWTSLPCISGESTCRFCSETKSGMDHPNGCEEEKTVEKQMNLLEEFPINRWWNVLQYYIVLYFSQRGIWIHSRPKLTQTTKGNFLVLLLKVMLLGGDEFISWMMMFVGWFDEFSWFVMSRGAEKIEPNLTKVDSEPNLVSFTTTDHFSLVKPCRIHHWEICNKCTAGMLLPGVFWTFLEP